jgi:protein-S-isoprenylcysteine O-methyltransferase Ste14
MIWWLGYVVLLVVLVVRVQTPDTAAHRPLRAGPDEPLGLVRAHHAVFYAILLGAPLEALAVGGPSRGRLIGLLAFGLGVLLYRVAGRALGDALSPLVTPRPGARLVTRGPYRHLRHPMYAGQALIAVGAPLTLGSRWVIWLSIPAIAILVLRARLEDTVLARTFPEHEPWAARAKGLIPFVL